MRYEASTRARSSECPGRIAASFDMHGVISSKSPRHWALAAAMGPLSQSAKTQDSGSGSRFSLRRQGINAQKTLEKDQKRRDLEVHRLCIEHHKSLSQGFVEDDQHIRHLRLLFEPMEELSKILPDGLFVELKREMIAQHPAATRRQSIHVVGFKNFVRTSLGMSAQSLRSDDDASVSSAQISSLENGEWVNLFSIFQRYVQRVGTEEDMCRSTWFRFLHHCGLLGPHGGIPFSQGASIYDMFSEVSAGVPTLPFSNWVNATQHIQQLFKEMQENANMFGVLLGRCEAKLGSSLALGGRSLGPFGWQSAAAEEQMCEPEVLQLLHEFQEPLERLFLGYATVDDESSEEEEEEEVEGAKVSPRKSVHFDIQERVEPAPRRKCGRRMPQEQFHTMLQDFKFFPTIVQRHSAQRHMEISMNRRGHTSLSYSGFIESLCRITFVYLSTYGNPVQQTAPSKRKCLWMFALLRASQETGTWHRAQCKLDQVPLRRLVLWRALDAGCTPPARYCKR